MQIAYHLGAHGTDEDRLVRALLKNRGTLAAQGIAVPSPRAYRQLLPRVAKTLRGAPAGPDTRQVILDALGEDGPFERLVFSHDSLLSFPVNAIGPDGLYPTAPARIVAYANLFPGAGAEFFLALKNPATLVPALLDRAAEASYDMIMSGSSPASLRWAPVIRRVLAQVPGIALTIWCAEDLPLLWPEVLRAIAGVSEGEALEGEYDLIGTLITEEGLAALKAFFETHPPRGVAQRRQATATFLEKYARPDELEVEITLPGWTEALVAAMAAAYDEDCAEIAAMPGVNFLAP
jgi:hypothetical protein